MSPTSLTITRRRVTKRAVVQLVLGLLLYGAGANVSAGWVVVLAAIVIGAVPWAWISATRAARSLTVTRELPPRATAGTDTPVALHLRSPTSAMAVVEDDLTRTVGVAGDLRDGTVLHASTVLGRGRRICGELRVHLADPFGLVTVTCAGEVASSTEVLPAIPRVRVPGTAATWALEAGQEASRIGDGVEVVGVREYRRGDALRAVHWRSSARRGQLVVRELADPARPRIRVELDAVRWPVTSLDRATEVACAVADDASRAGYPVVVAADGVTAPWDPSVHRMLAAIPPHAGAPPRPLTPPPPSDAEVTVLLTPGPGGVAVSRVDADGRTVLGLVPDGADLAAVEAWLALRVGGA